MTPRQFIALRCGHCGNAVLSPRGEDDPDSAVELETSECDICEATNGGFSEDLYLDRDGAIVWLEDRDE